MTACGFDCIPSDLEVIFTQQKFGGDFNTVEIYLNVLFPDEGPCVTYGSWESAIHHLAHLNELWALHRKLYPLKLLQFTPKLKLRYGSFLKLDLFNYKLNLL